MTPRSAISGNRQARQTLHPLIWAMRIRATSRTRGSPADRRRRRRSASPTAAPSSGESDHTWMSSPPSPSGTVILAMGSPPGPRPPEPTTFPEIPLMSVVPIRDNEGVTTLPLPLLPSELHRGEALHPALARLPPRRRRVVPASLPRGPDHPAGRGVAPRRGRARHADRRAHRVRARRSPDSWSASTGSTAPTSAARPSTGSPAWSTSRR